MLICLLFGVNQVKIRKEDALEYHSSGRKGKIEVVVSKPCSTQRDLSLAYSPGVAEPCREIHKDVSKVFEYTAKGNLVAVISNGTAVLGLGDIGPEAGKPVMEGKGVLFKTFADIDVFDIELKTKDIDEFVRTCELMEPTFGGINLEDIKGPDCFFIEQELKKRMKIPVFHDDQHGTAIISGAGLLNALEVVGKKIEDVKVVYNGAGASGIACAKFHISLGVNPKNVLMCDSTGVIYKGREKGMNEFKEDFAVETDRRTLADAFVDADVFMGLSQGNVVSKDMIKSMAKDPIVFALANPDPEIPYEDAFEVRKDLIMATGRSDYPNQVNNVLGFPFIFRGALDVSATAINEEMKRAAAYAIAALAKEEVPESVKRAYGVKQLSFGRDYIIPKPFDHRALTWISSAVAKAAMDTGVAQNPIEDFEEYKLQLNIRMGRTEKIMVRMFDKARVNPKKVVFPEGEQPRIIRAAQLSVDAGIAHPILIGDEEVIKQVAEEHGYELDGVKIVNPAKFEKIEEYIEEYHKLRERKGIVRLEARKRMRTRPNYFGAMMVRMGDADAMVSGIAATYPDTIRPALEIIGKEPGYNKVSGLYIANNKNTSYFLADTTVNIDPSAEDLADIALQAADFATKFDITPRVAMLSYSNFGSSPGATSKKISKALDIIKKRDPELNIDGEIHANVAVSTQTLKDVYPFSKLKEAANVLIFPDLNSGNIGYKLLSKVAGLHSIGPVLLGMSKSVHIIQNGEEMNNVLNMVAIAVVDAQTKEENRCALKK
jgi:malate dehydrogenase (oxaloacetate-decarboxylating)(NADP+)